MQSAPKVLLISSTVATSRVGASAASFCLQRLGVETVILPTTLMGRHPGWGAPGGGAVETARLSDMWTAIRAQNLTFNAVLTGYMGERSHVDLAAEIIADVRDISPDAKIWVDPVMGDNGALYIPEDRAAAIRDHLVPLADCITPNLWELSWLSGQDLHTPQDIRAQATNYPSALVTSVPDAEQIGAVWQDADGAWITAHARFDSVPHGGGDSLAAILLAHHLRGLDAQIALRTAVGSIFDIMRAADAVDAGELPLVRCQSALIAPNLLDLKDYA